MSLLEVLQLIYASKATQPFSGADLEELLGIARRNNTKADVTGMLVHEDGSFLQVLEGPDAAVEALFDRIQKDPRHTKTVMLWRAQITERTFGDWKMGFVEGSEGALRKVPGYYPFFHPSYFLSQPDAGGSKALHVLRQFRSGKFHSAA